MHLSPSDIIAPFENKSFGASRNIDNWDLRQKIVAGVPMAEKQISATGAEKQFRGRTERETVQKIYNYVIQNLGRKYLADGSEDQDVKLPAAIFAPGISSDCKSWALFIAATLEKLKIPYSFVFASYDKKEPVPSHVYIQTKSGITIDPVYGRERGVRFGDEKPFAYRYFKPMNSKYITGTSPALGCSSCSGPEGIEGLGDKLKQLGSWVKEKAQDVKQGVKKVAQKAKEVSLAPGRTVFRIMTETNLDGFATKLAKMNQQTVLDYWAKIGGDKAKLSKSIQRGAARAPKKFGFLAKLKKKQNVNGLSGGGEYLEEAIIIAAPAAGAAVGSLVPGAGTAVGTGAGASFGAVLIAIMPVVQQLLSMTGDEKAPEGDNFFNPGPLPPVDPNEIVDNPNNATSGTPFLDQTALFGIKNKYLILGTIAIGAGVYVAKKHKLF